LVPVYVAECSPPHIRGRLVGLYEVGVQFGTMVGFWIPYGVLKTLKGTPQWRIPFAIQLIPVVVSRPLPRACVPALSLRVHWLPIANKKQGCIIGLFFLTETPRFMVRRHGEARGELDPRFRLISCNSPCNR
jgi:MFS family permease